MTGGEEHRELQLAESVHTNWDDTEDLDDHKVDKLVDVHPLDRRRHDIHEQKTDHECSRQLQTLAV